MSRCQHASSISENRVAAVGVSDLIIVASGDSVLIMPRGQSQDVKRVVAAVKEQNDVLKA